MKNTFLFMVFLLPGLAQAATSSVECRLLDGKGKELKTCMLGNFTSEKDGVETRGYVGSCTINLGEHSELSIEPGKDMALIEAELVQNSATTEKATIRGRLSDGAYRPDVSQFKMKSGLSLVCDSIDVDDVL